MSFPLSDNAAFSAAQRGYDNQSPDEDDMPGDDTDLELGNNREPIAPEINEDDFRLPR